LELQRRNEERENEGCICVPLEDVLRGPGRVAWKFIKDIKDNPDSDFEFNEEQILVIALLIWPLEQAWRKQLKAGQSRSATVDTLRKLPNALGLPRTLVIGGGGCGKTTLMQLVVAPVARTYFTQVVFTAPSNRAARGFDPRAKTMHSIAGIRPVDSMRTASLHIKGDQMRKRWARI